MAERQLRRQLRNPAFLLAATFQPMLWVLLFAYVFASAISAPGYEYTDFFVPGIAIQLMVINSFPAAIGIATDLRLGLMDRLRSLPMSRSAVIAGRTLADGLVNVLALAVIIAAGYLVGFTFQTTALEVAAGCGLAVAFGYAMSWVFCYVGLRASSPEAAAAFVTVIVLPLTYIASVYVPTEMMPENVQAFAEANPMTTAVDALRSLWLGAPAGTDIRFAVIWCVGLTASFGILATIRYARSARL